MADCKSRFNMKKKFSKELTIGLSFIIAILILVFGIDYLKGINLFSPANYYYADYTDVSDLEVSAPVTINGYKVGQVRSISYNYEHPGKIRVQLALNKNLHVPENSTATLAQTMLSGAYVSIVLGDSKKMLSVGDEIKTQHAAGLMEALSDNVMPKVNQILPRVDSLLANLNTLVADPALLASIQRLDGITANVLGVTQGLDKTVKGDVPRVMSDVKSITHQIDTVSRNLVVLSHTLRSLPLATTIDNVNDITESLSSFSNQLNDPNSTIGLLTRDPELYNRINRVAADVDSLIVDIKRNPKRYISIKVF